MQYVYASYLPESNYLITKIRHTYKNVDIIIISAWLHNLYWLITHSYAEHCTQYMYMYVLYLLQWWCYDLDLHCMAGCGN